MAVGYAMKCVVSGAGGSFRTGGKPAAILELPVKYTMSDNTGDLIIFYFVLTFLVPTFVPTFLRAGKQYFKMAELKERSENVH